jgi:hypothetical protein
MNAMICLNRLMDIRGYRPWNPDADGWMDWKGADNLAKARRGTSLHGGDWVELASE